MNRLYKYIHLFIFINVYEVYLNVLLLIYFRCFLYETGSHHSGEKFTYHLAQSGDSTCSALTSVSEGSRTIKLTKGKR